MPDRPALTPAYSYDGTFEGLLCCVFESYEKKEMPPAIFGPDEAQTTLFPAREIATDLSKAWRVAASIPRKISGEAQELVRLAFLTCLPQKELYILRFLRLGYRYGGGVVGMLADDTVHALQKAVGQLRNESHLLSGFVRFSVSDGALTAVIGPKNQVLPLLAPHFCARYADEAFLIYDKTHGMALVYQNGRHEIIPVEALTLPEPDEHERGFRRLWRAFYQTIAIRERDNPRCRMTHLPKRYWEYMTEFQTDAPPGEAGPTPCGAPRLHG